MSGPRSRIRGGAFALAAAVFLAVPAVAGTGEGSVLSITKIQDNGPDTSRFNIVIMGDGYTTAQMPAFEARAQEVVTAFNAQLSYGSCGGAVNFYRVNIESDQSGSDKPAPCYTPAVSRDTYLDTRYCQGGTQRCVWSTNTGLVQSTASAATANWHFVVVLVNDPEHGGCAGSQLTFNATGPGFESTVMHELGHALGGLADEYEYDGPDTYAGGEPGQANLTIATDRGDVKWFDLIEGTTPIPTWNRTDCTAGGEEPPVSLEGAVGTFEGGAYSRCGIFHPERTCLMRVLHTDFCAVCNRRIRQVMSDHLSSPNLAITPWGYARNPRDHPYWQSPDVWVDNDLDGVQEPDEPLIGKSDNRLFARISNLGDLPSGPFQVRFSYVPYTTVIDLPNSQPIGTVSRPGLGAGLTDEVEISWPLDAVPPEFAGIDHFCVIVEILTEECDAGNNKAQNNFTSIETQMPAPAKLAFLVENVLDVAAFGALEIELTPPAPGWTFKADVPNLSRFPLQPREKRRIELELHYRQPPGENGDGGGAGGPVEQDLDITFRLEGQVLGGVSARVRVLPDAGGRWSASLHLGVVDPRSGIGDFFHEGPSVMLDVGYRLTDRVSLIGYLGSHRFDSEIGGVWDAKFWSLSAVLRWELGGGPLRPYLQAGPGLYDLDYGSTEWGYLLGAGVAYELAPAWDLELGVNYHVWPEVSPDIEFLQPLVGLVRYF